MDQVIKNPYAQSVRGFVCLLIAISLLGCGESRSPTVPTDDEVGVEVGDLAPDFEFEDTDGRVVRLSDQRGSVVLVHLWALWCPGCIPQLEEVQRAYDDYRGRDLVVLSIGWHTKDTVQEVRQQFGFTFPMLMDPEGHFRDRFKTRTLPFSMIVDRRGHIDYRSDSFREGLSEILIRERIESLLGG